jgi:hypothetical protein
MRQIAVLFLFVLFSGAALAAQSDTDFELRRLSTLLDAVRQEQQSVYQQFQMAEAMQRSESKSAESGPPPVAQDGRPPSYDDNVRAKQELQTRLKYYADEMRRLSDKYRDLGNQSAALMEEIRALAKAPR